MARITVFNDSFTGLSGGDLATVSSDWELNNTTATEEWAVVSEHLEADSSAGGRRIAQVTGQTYANDQYAKFEVTALSTLANANLGPCVRCQSPATSESVYKLALKDTGTTLAIEKYEDGASTVLGTPATVSAPARPFTLTLEVEGTTLRGYINEVEEVSVTDSTFTSGVPGIFQFDADTSLNVDNFESGNITSGATPTISNIDGDNAVNQYQQGAVIALSGYTETVTSVTLNAVDCPIQSQVVGTSVTVDLPGSLSTGSYDLIVSGATETDTLSGVSYTQTHQFTSPYGQVDSNSLFDGQVLTEDSYHRIVSGPTNGTLDTATAEASSLWGNDVDDIYTPDPEFTGGDAVTLEILYDDGTTAQWAATITVAAPDTVGPVVTSVSVPANGSRKAGDNLDFTINLDEAAEVTGTPALNLTIGGSARQANYVSGDGTSALLLRYTVQAGDNDADGIAVNSLTLDGGTIKDAAGNDANLTLNSVGDTTGVLVDTVKPAITVTGSNPATVVVGETYTDQGATASDDQDGSLGSVVGTGTVDTNTVGQYIITYPGAGIVDSAGNVADDATRTVNVVSELPVATSGRRIGRRGAVGVSLRPSIGDSIH